MTQAIDLSDPELAPVRFSRLRLLALSPAHYQHAQQTGTSAMAKGTAVHSVLLGGKRVTFYPKLTEAGKAAPRNGKDWEAFRADNPDAQILTRPEVELVNGMVAAVRANRDAMRALDGEREKTILFKFLGIDCRTTPDARSDTIVSELKTSQSAAPDKFLWQMLKMRTHAQMAFHRIGIVRAKLPEPAEHMIVVVESTPPFPVTVMRLTPRAIEKGEKQIRLWFETLKGCLASNQFPAYAQSVVDLDVPDEEILFSDESPGDEPASIPF